MKYAAKTTVSSERTRIEIESILQKYGAIGFVYGWREANAMISFQMNGRVIRFILPLPDKFDRAFTHTESRGSERHPDDAMKSWEQACRQAWRALLLCIKAKLEACESGITTFDNEFLAHIMTNKNETIGDRLIPQLTEFTSGNLALPWGKL